MSGVAPSESGDATWHFSSIFVCLVVCGVRGNGGGTWPTRGSTKVVHGGGPLFMLLHRDAWGRRVFASYLWDLHQLKWSVRLNHAIRRSASYLQGSMYLPTCSNHRLRRRDRNEGREPRLEATLQRLRGAPLLQRLSKHTRPKTKTKQSVTNQESCPPGDQGHPIPRPTQLRPIRNKSRQLLFPINGRRLDPQVETRNRPRNEPRQ